MTNDNEEPSAASAGPVAERPLGDPEIAVEILRLRVAELEEAIRRLAEEDATLSLLCKRDGSQVVTVTMDAPLTDAEREAVAWAEYAAEKWCEHTAAATLRGLLERLK
jgi:hypothetical protein